MTTGVPLFVSAPPVNVRPLFMRSKDGTESFSLSLMFLKFAIANSSRISVGDGAVEVGAGAAADPDLVLEAGPGFRDLLAGTLDPRAALAEGLVTIEGDPALLDDFTSIFRVPYGPDA